MVVGLLGVVAYMTWWKPDTAVDTPSVQSESHTLSTHTYTSTGGMTIELNNWPNDGVVASPLTVNGKVPGSWSSEGAFPVELLDGNGTRLSDTTAVLQGDWMTDAMVPFTATLPFAPMAEGQSGTLVLRKDNPSGLSENDDSVSIEVRFSL
jgi:hypothetical protein